jgi:hypothetical protein
MSPVSPPKTKELQERDVPHTTMASTYYCKCEMSGLGRQPDLIAMRTWNLRKRIILGPSRKANISYNVHLIISLYQNNYFVISTFEYICIMSTCSMKREDTNSGWNRTLL